jgi:hypothetical protein
MSQRVKTSARGLVLPRSSSPENGHLRKNSNTDPTKNRGEPRLALEMLSFDAVLKQACIFAVEEHCIPTIKSVYTTSLLNSKIISSLIH